MKYCPECMPGVAYTSVDPNCVVCLGKGKVSEAIGEFFSIANLIKSGYRKDKDGYYFSSIDRSGE